MAYHHPLFVFNFNLTQVKYFKIQRGIWSRRNPLELATRQVLRTTSIPPLQMDVSPVYAMREVSQHVEHFFPEHLLYVHKTAELARSLSHWTTAPSPSRKARVQHPTWKPEPFLLSRRSNSLCTLNNTFASFPPHSFISPLPSIFPNFNYPPPYPPALCFILPFSRFR